MNEFIEQCRREWKRLGVSGDLIEEMASELAGDLREAESEGVSSVQVLGSSAFDPRSFAASWAIERGLAEPPSDGRRLRRLPFALGLVTTILAFVMIGAAATMLASDASRPSALLFGGPASSAQLTTAPSWIPYEPLKSGDDIDPIAWILLAVGIVGIASASFFWTAWARNRPRFALAPS